MFGRKKKAKISKKDKPFLELTEAQNAYLKEFAEKLDKTEKIEDSADRILKLDALAVEINKASNNISFRRNNIVNAKADKAFEAGALGGGVGAAAAIGVPLGILVPPLLPLAILGVGGTLLGIPIAISVEKKAQKKLDKLNPGYPAFEKTMQEYCVRALNARDDAARTCKLEEVSQSPKLKKALAENATLRDRFTEAAKKAIAEKAGQPQEQAEQPAANNPEARKKFGSYDTLKM
jgi:hypothetical protein